MGDSINYSNLYSSCLAKELRFTYLFISLDHLIVLSLHLKSVASGFLNYGHFPR